MSAAPKFIAMASEQMQNLLEYAPNIHFKLIRWKDSLSQSIFLVR